MSGKLKMDMRLKEAKFSKEDRRNLDLIVKRYFKIKRKAKLNKVKHFLLIYKKDR